MNLIPFVSPDIRNEDFLCVAEVLKSGWLNEGPVTEELEAKFAEYIGVKHAIATTSGTMALMLIYHAMGDVYHIHDFVIPSMTFVATANAAIVGGASARIVDSIQDFQTNSSQSLITVHLGGKIGDLPKHSFLIEDACHALGSERTVRLGSTSVTKKAGSIGCAAAFSFQSEKLIGIGQGGMITTSDDCLAVNMRAVKSQGRIKGTNRTIEGGFNAKITDYQAVLVLCQLNRINEQIGARINACAFWIEGAVEPSEVLIPKTGEVPLFTRLSFPSSRERDLIFSELLNKGIESRKPYMPLHKIHRIQGSFSRASVIFETELWLPNHRLIADRESEVLINALKKCL